MRVPIEVSYGGILKSALSCFVRRLLGEKQWSTKYAMALEGVCQILGAVGVSPHSFWAFDLARSPNSYGEWLSVIVIVAPSPYASRLIEQIQTEQERENADEAKERA
jgi:hypothetical protein